LIHQIWNATKQNAIQHGAKYIANLFNEKSITAIVGDENRREEIMRLFPTAEIKPLHKYQFS